MSVQELIKKYAAGERDFEAIDLAEANLSRVNLGGSNLSRATLSIANLSGANLNRANLSYAKLNVARLSGTNLIQANLNGAILNVANMIRANLTEANLVQAALIRAEMIRANLTQANLNEANLNGADLRESKLDRADLGGVNLSEADLRGATMVGANLSQSNLNGTDLSKADLGGADLTHTELRHAQLHRANLSGASLRGANLRWADLSGADLRWADLSDAKLSGANLIGANLSHANLLNTSFVHADLTQANLMRSDWEGADLSGAILTGAKLYGVSRFSLRTEGMSCEWIDMSPNGDRSRICRFTPEDFQKFFNQTHPIVQIIVDMPLTQEANFALAQMYYQIFQKYPELGQPPSVDVGYRQTILTLRVETDELLFPIAYVAMFPFTDAEATQRSALHFVKLIQSKSSDILGVKESNRVAKLSVSILKKMRIASTVDREELLSPEITNCEFFQAPTQTVLTNSSSQMLKVYHNPMFGKRFLDRSGESLPVAGLAIKTKPVALPPASVVLEFIQSFYSLDEVTSSSS
ncbi:MAG: pentapeptide repeat-containing protein [Cyanobacteriota bacterium]|nr:pentapeptide repeat-containing protein [Cyanobacteriota bacterium]